MRGKIIRIQNKNKKSDIHVQISTLWYNKQPVQASPVESPFIKMSKSATRVFIH